MSQRTYYELRADDYCDPAAPSDRRVRGLVTPEVTRTVVDGLRPTGDVLELACGTGESTRELVRYADSVTAVDGSPRMLEINRARLQDRRVTYLNADIFTWQPDRTYDVVFFSFWLSHVPPRSFDAFWNLVRRCLSPNGRVAFIDEDDRAAGNDDGGTINGVPTARRKLRDGRTFDIVKVFWRPEDLEARLKSSGWDVGVRPVGGTFLFGVGRRADG